MASAARKIEKAIKPSPFLKYVGGKSRLVPEILPRLPTKMRTYFEPFVGGGAVFFALADEQPRRYKWAVLSDVNAELINTYKVVRDHPEKLVRLLDRLAPTTAEWDYFEVRAERERLNTVQRAARFIYLNKTCFRGMHRTNKEGQFNVPFGHYKNPALYDLETLVACSEALQGVMLYSVPFNMIDPKRGDVIYCDPPYAPRTVTASFQSYTPNGFNRGEHCALVEHAAQWCSHGAHVLVSNSDTRFTRGLFGSTGALLEKVSTKYAVNPHEKGAKSRSTVGELLVTFAPVSRP